MTNSDNLSGLLVSRRAALKLGVLGVAGLAIPGCTQESTFEPRPFVAQGLSPDSAAWRDLRTHFNILPDVRYMNNASIGMPPAIVSKAVADGYRAQSEDPIQAKHDLQDRIRDASLPALGRFFGVHADEITLTRNASVALHLQAVGLDLRAGDHVVITTQEHPAGRKPWQFRETRHGVDVTEVFIPSPLPSIDEIISRFEEAVGPRTRAIAFCHVTRGGHLYPVKELCSWARGRGLSTLVDGAQAVGQFNINLGDLGCDTYSASLHKWTLAPCGTGFLYVRQDARDRFHSSFEPDKGSFSFGIPGTADFPIRAAVATAIEFMESIGMDQVEARCRHLSEHLKASLEVEDVVTLLSGERERSAPGSTIFEIDGVDAIEAVDRLAEQNIHIDEHQRDGHNAIRISTHIYNSTDDVDAAVEALLTMRV
ncbi:MAG: aminotransferase class V-fold PLP-dependent enzyme [Bacteroidota bacterium]|nr:aminotransferase class V-fold PLP-dependent enzyme [Bacteroidota bacterium]